MKSGMYKWMLLTLVWGVMFGAYAQLTSSFTLSGSNGSCRGTAVMFTNTSTGATSSMWDFGDGGISSQTSPSYTFTNPGTFIVTLTTSDGTSSLVSKKPIYIRDYPYASFNLSGSGFYSGVLPGEILKPVNNSNGSLTYMWNNGGGFISTSANVNFSYANPGNYVMSLITTNGCGDSSTYSTNVIVIDTNNFTPVASGYVSQYTVCPGSPVSFNNYTNKFTAIKWMMGNGQTRADQESFDYVYPNKGNYHVALIAYYKAKSDTQYFDILVSDTGMDHSLVYANISPQVYDQVTYQSRYMTCAGSPFKFSGTWSSEIIKHTWKLPGGITLIGKDTQYSFANIGDYPLVYVCENKCGVKDSLTFILSVRVADSIPANRPSVMMNAGPNGNICMGGKIYASVYSSNTSMIKWIFHDGTSVMNNNEVWKQYPVAGLYPIKVVAQTGCHFDTVTTNINVVNTAESFAGFNLANAYSASSPVCAGDTVYCMADSNYSSTYKSVNISQHNWYMGDGTIYHTASVKHKYASAGWYSILHETVNACGQKAVTAQTVWMNSNTVPIANFYLLQHTACTYDSIMIDQFSTKSDSILIKMGDGDRIYLNRNNYFPHLWYAYHTPGNYIVRLYAYNQCGVDSATDHILVMPPPVAQILLNDTSIEIGSTLTLNANFTGVAKHLWFYGPLVSDTTSSNQLVRTFNTLGKYKVMLRTQNAAGCENEDSVWITVVKKSALTEQSSLGINASIYPNPTTGMMYIDLVNSTTDGLLLRMVDLKGNTIYTHEYAHLNKGTVTLDYDISVLPAGVYFVHLSNHSGAKTFKLMKQ